MAAERKPGSNRGRTTVDWEAAFACYASLPDSERCYQAVADQFGVSVRTVEAHGRREGWKERLAGIKRVAGQSANAKLAEGRAAKLAEVELLIEASLATLANQLRNGSTRVSVSDLVKLCTLRNTIWAETDQAAERAVAAAAASDDAGEDPLVRAREVARALQQAGAFERLNDLIDPQPGSGPRGKESG